MKRHHAEATDLLDKIVQLETLCFGAVVSKTLPDRNTTVGYPPRVAYRIEKLDVVNENLKNNFPESTAEINFWKFAEFIKARDGSAFQNVEISEIFRESTQIAVLAGFDYLSKYENAWVQVSMPFNAKAVGQFGFGEIGEFFGNNEIVIEHKLIDQAGQTVFWVLLPYQAIFIAVGEPIYKP